MRKSNAMPLNEAIDGFLNRYRMKQKLHESKILKDWEEMVGKTIARHTTGLFLKGKKLFIKVDSAPLKQELLYSKEKIAEILNQRYQETVVEEIIIR